MNEYLRCVACLALAAWGCARSAPQPVQTPVAPPPQVELGNCERAEEIICATAGDESDECESVKKALTLLPKTACALSHADEESIKAKLSVLRSRCEELVQRLCHDMGENTSTCAMVTRQTATFPPARCQLMLGRYDEVLTDLRKMEAVNQPLSDEKLKLIADTTGPSFGPLDAKVVVVVFSDFQCPFCAKASNTLREIRSKYKSYNVRLVFRQFPLKFHENAHLAAEASLAAHAQGKFWELHDAMFENNTALTRADLEKYAQLAGLNMQRFKKDLDSHRFAADVDADIKVGEAVSVQGTPTMFVGAVRVPNPTDAESTLDRIKAALGQ